MRNRPQRGGDYGENIDLLSSTLQKSQHSIGSLNAFVEKSVVR